MLSPNVADTGGRKYTCRQQLPHGSRSGRTCFTRVMHQQFTQINASSRSSRGAKKVARNIWWEREREHSLSLGVTPCPVDQETAHSRPSSSVPQAEGWHNGSYSNASKIEWLASVSKPCHVLHFHEQLQYKGVLFHVDNTCLDGYLLLRQPTECKWLQSHCVKGSLGLPKRPLSLWLLSSWDNQFCLFL